MSLEDKFYEFLKFQENLGILPPLRSYPRRELASNLNGMAVNESLEIGARNVHLENENLVLQKKIEMLEETIRFFEKNYEGKLYYSNLIKPETKPEDICREKISSALEKYKYHIIMSNITVGECVSIDVLTNVIVNSLKGE